MWIPIRIEQVAVGAAVNGNVPPEAAYLRPQDFAYTTGAAVYQAVASARAANPGADALEVAQRCAPALADHFVSGHALLAYAARAAQTPAGQVAKAHRVLLRNGSNTELDTARHRIESWTEEKEDPALHLPELVHAAGSFHQVVQRRATLMTFLPANIEADDTELWDTWYEPWNPPVAPDEPDAAWLDAEKTILAGLIQHPRLLWTIGPWLDYSTFHSPAHQDAFDHLMILGDDLDRAENPLASLTTALLKADRTGAGAPADRVTPQIRQQEISELATIAAIPVSAHACVQAASQLLHRDLTERASQSTTANLEPHSSFGAGPGIDPPSTHPQPRP